MDSIFHCGLGVGLYRVREQPWLGEEVTDTSTIILNVLSVVGQMILAFPAGVPHLLWKEITQMSRHMFVLNDTLSVCLTTCGVPVAAPFVVHSISAYQGVVHMRSTNITDKGQDTSHEGREKMTEDVHLFVS
jgi:hypothetical protein